ncbi:hypothetical protein PUG46_01725 [Erwiniaceae bacterium L1_55_4]|nr:hypothetical protein [Erwiniaceae bacterium L1_55_4]
MPENNVSILDEGINTEIDIAKDVKLPSSVKISISGKNNKITIKEKCKIRNLNITISGENNTLTIHSGCNLRGGFHIRHAGSSLTIGAETSIVGANIFCLEGAHVRLGENCMLSSGIYIRNSDEHPIYDIKSNQRLNPAKDVSIGDNVWISEGVTINKGVIISNGIIIGARSLVINELDEENSIYAGVPAKHIKSGVRWERHLPKNN